LKTPGEFYRAALCKKDSDGTLTDKMDDHVYGCTLNEVIDEAVAAHSDKGPLRITEEEPVNREGGEEFRIFSYHAYRPLAPGKIELAKVLLFNKSYARRKNNKAGRKVGSA